MRKQDYLILAAAIKKHRDSAMAYATQNGLQPDNCEAAECAKRIAHTFARFANVDKIEFLKACGIHP